MQQNGNRVSFAELELSRYILMSEYYYKKGESDQLHHSKVWAQ